jgi:hypothetical protein
MADKVQPLEAATPSIPKAKTEACWNCGKPLDGKGNCAACGFQKSLLYNGEIEAAAAAKRKAETEAALNKAAEAIPIPMLSTVVSAGVAFAAGEVRKELHTRSITEADTTLLAKSQGELRALFTTDTDALEVMQNSMAQYKAICKLIESMPKGAPKTFDEAIAAPTTTFRIEQAVSALNVTVLFIGDYLESLSDRLVRCREVMQSYKEELRRDTPVFVAKILDETYKAALAKGKDHIRRKKYVVQKDDPLLQRVDSRQPATVHLSALMAHAFAKGYYDAFGEWQLGKYF